MFDVQNCFGLGSKQLQNNLLLNTGRKSDWCFLCELQQHIAKVQQSRSPLSPVKILNRIRNIGSHLGYGKQEDAHEFMRFPLYLLLFHKMRGPQLSSQCSFVNKSALVPGRLSKSTFKFWSHLCLSESRFLISMVFSCYLEIVRSLDICCIFALRLSCLLEVASQVTHCAWNVISFAINSMQSICLDEVGGAKAVDISAQETTLIKYIFGGQLQSQVNTLLQDNKIAQLQITLG